MEVIPATIAITRNTEACFIERGHLIKSWNKTLIVQWLQEVGPEIRYTDYMKNKVALASRDEELTWKVIQAADHIWCQSYFIGDSAHLFARMLARAVTDGVRDKFFFNLAERSVACGELYCAEPSARGLIQTLKGKQNIKFFFWEEIAEMMHVSAYP